MVNHIIISSFQSHHHRPQSSASTYLSPSYASSLSRASSVREARATTEERSSAAAVLKQAMAYALITRSSRFPSAPYAIDVGGIENLRHF